MNTKSIKDFLMSKLLKYKYFAIFALTISILLSIILFAFSTDRKVIGSDGIGYNAYLPAILIDSDLSFTKLINRHVTSSGREVQEIKTCPPTLPICNEYLGLLPSENGGWFNKYPVGIAVVTAPTYLVADGLVQLTSGQRDGLSPFYQYAIVINTILVSQIGLYFTYRVLKKRFSIKLTLLLLTILVFGTNFLHYIVYEPSMSHIYSYTLIVILIFLLDKYLTKKTNKTLFLMGLTLAFIGLIRNLNILVGIIPFLLILSEQRPDMRIKMAIKLFFMWGLTTFIVMIPQFLYWKYATGNFIAYSYPGEVFNLSTPHLYEILFQVQSNGLFFWHPLLLLVIPGIYFWIKSKDKISLVSTIFLIALIYLLSCWWAYWFGYSFGMRAFTDYLILFLIPIGYLIKQFSDSKKIIRFILALILIFFLMLNLIQMNNYWRGIVAPPNITWERYIENFFDLNIDFKRRLDSIF